MVPRTYPSNADGDMIVAEISPTGLVEWTDYIPIQEVADGTESHYDNDGYIPVESVSEAGRVAWVDYIPVVVVEGRSSRWVVNSDGFIPVVGAGDPPSLFSFDANAFDTDAFDVDSFLLG